MLDNDTKYLKLLSAQYPNADSACNEIISLKATLNLPKGTEHFVSDIHGEYCAFNHVIRNASGVIKSTIEDVFGSSLRESSKKTLATLIYYPTEKLALIKKNEKDIDDWYRTTLIRLLAVFKAITAKYKRSAVRKAIPEELLYIFEELLNESETEIKKKYYDELIENILSLGQADRFICELCNLIDRFAIAHLHVIGDIYDRGPDAVKIIDMLMNYHSLDIQWGNHDISWIGAAAGCESLICNVIRIQARYGNLETLEEDYGINLIPLATFAMNNYKDDDCDSFVPKTGGEIDNELRLAAKMHKAISIMQFKYESQLIKRHPEFNMDKRLLLDTIDLEKGEFELEGKKYKLNDTYFPTVDPDDPTALTDAEIETMEKIKFSFTHNEKLQRHVQFLLRKGGIYKIFNDNLLYHGIIPLNEDGTLRTINYRGEPLKGKAYLDEVDKTVREAYYEKENADDKLDLLDHVWFLWENKDSPLFGKQKMTTFERYFTDDKSTYEEGRDSYYESRNNEKVCQAILEDFGLTSKYSHIVNGHVPVHAKTGESPIKSGGKLFVIDGGFAKAYQDVTGIAGYTLIFNPRGLLLVSHDPFTGVEDAVSKETDVASETVGTFYSQDKILVADTDRGKELKIKINDLEALLYAYSKGLIKETE